jgi:ribosomal protein S27AE
MQIVVTNKDMQRHTCKNDILTSTSIEAQDFLHHTSLFLQDAEGVYVKHHICSVLLARHPERLVCLHGVMSFKMGAPLMEEVETSDGEWSTRSMLPTPTMRERGPSARA